MKNGVAVTSSGMIFTSSFVKFGYTRIVVKLKWSALSLSLSHTHTHTHIYIYIYRERERERELFLVSWGGLRPSPLLGQLYQPRMMDGGECGAVGGMVGRGNQSTREYSVSVSLCSTQIPHDLPRAQTRATAVASRRLTDCLSYGMAFHTHTRTRTHARTHAQCGHLRFTGR
jgi:hypothetical protein